MSLDGGGRSRHRGITPLGYRIMIREKAVVFAVSTSLLVATVVCSAAKETPLYRNDPEIIPKLECLKAGHALLLPRERHMAGGKPIKAEGRSGPYSRDYTTKMAYAPERQTALYCGGNHGPGRMNDVWEYHLGSNAWHRLHLPVGGDHAKHKNMLMFYPRRLDKDPNYRMSAKEKDQFALAKAWWNENVVLRDGHYVTKEREAPLLVGHTWDTLVYEPNIRRLIHGTGAHCAGSPWLHNKFTGMPLKEVEGKLGRNENGVPYRTMWLFDPTEKRWSTLR